MSLTYTSSEAIVKSKNARRNAAVTTLLVTILFFAGILILFGFFVIRGIQNNPPVITPIQQPPTQETVITQPELITEPQPDAPASASPMSMEVVTVMQPSNFSIKDVSLDATTLSPGVSSVGFKGLGLKGFGDNSGNGGSGFSSFFGIETSGERTAYVVDFSGSNNPRQRQLIKLELKKTLEAVNSGFYQIIGFSGPVWFMGDKIKFSGSGNPTVITGRAGRKYEYVWENKGRLVYEIIDNSKNAPELPVGQWLNQGDTRASLRQLEENIVWSAGTDYAIGLETALRMNPQPDTIYFITDGAHIEHNNLSLHEVNQKYGDLLRNKNIDLVCLALATDKALRGLQGLSLYARGKLILVQEDGQGELVEDFSKMSSQKIEAYKKKNKIK